MDKRRDEMRFHGAQPVRRLYKESRRKSSYLVGEELLALKTSQVFNQRVAEYKVKRVIRELTSSGIGNNPAYKASRIISSWTDIEHGDLGKRKA